MIFCYGKCVKKDFGGIKFGKCFVALIRRGQQNLVLFVLSMGYAGILLGKSKCLLGKEFILIINEVCEDVR